MSIISNDSAVLVKKALSFRMPDRLPVFINAFWDEFTAVWRQRDNSRTNIEIEDYFGNGGWQRLSERQAMVLTRAC